MTQRTGASPHNPFVQQQQQQQAVNSEYLGLGGCKKLRSFGGPSLVVGWLAGWLVYSRYIVSFFSLLSFTLLISTSVSISVSTVCCYFPSPLIFLL